MPAIICKANFNTTCPRKVQGDLQNAEFVAGFQFREECFLLQLKRGVSGQDRGYSFRNARNRVDAAQRLQRFVLCVTYRKRQKNVKKILLDLFSDLAVFECGT
jgi:hypothetical protein